MLGSDQKSWWQAMGDALRLVSVAMLTILLTVIVSDVFTYAYAASFLSLPIVLAHAQPTLVTLGASAIAVVAVNVVVEVVTRFQDVAVIRRLMKHGTYVGLISFEKPVRFAMFVVAAYLVAPAIVGRITAAFQTTFQVVKLTEPKSELREAIIVTPTVNGVLLALYDRTKNAVNSRETLVDTLGPGEPRFAQREQLGHLKKQ